MPFERPDSLAVNLTGAVLGAVALVALSGCMSSGALRAAEMGNLAELRREIAAELARGELDDDEARAIARAIASTEVRGASGPVGEGRIGEVASCARPLADALEERASRSDDVGAAAAMVRLEAKLDDAVRAAGRAAEAGAQTGGAASWRALEARALVGPGSGTLRRKRIVDGDQGVRIAALRAAGEAADPADADAVIEAARLDPLPLARTAAIRAAGTLGGERVVLALKDLWVSADEPAREAIADVWASRGSLDAGGRRELLWAAESQPGAPSIAAAYALVRTGGAGASEGLGVLTRGIATGAMKDRIYAITVAPLTAAPIRDAIRKAEDDPDEAVWLAAATKSLEASSAGGAPVGSKERARLVVRVMKLAQGASTHALIAKASLARADVREVVPMLAKDVQSKDERVREAAGTALAGLGELPRAVILTADPDPHLRTTVACAILRAPGN